MERQTRIMGTVGQMLKEERQYHLLERLRQAGKIIAQDMSQELQVSEDTIRRDLRELAAAGKLQRVHGGAIVRPPNTGTFAERTAHAAEAKVALARVAAQFVQEGHVVLLDGGTTNVEVARQLPGTLTATVVTPSPSVALALLDHSHVEVLMLGGRLYKRSATNVGIATAEALRGVRADLCLLGVCSLHPELGISVSDPEEAQLKRLMIAQSTDVMAVAIADKLGTALPHIVGPLRLITYLVTERVVPREVVESYQAHGLTVIQR